MQNNFLQSTGGARMWVVAVESEVLNRVKARVKWVFAGAAAMVAALQLTNPTRTNLSIAAGRDLVATNAPPPEISALLREACYDCHSYETKWPWYSHVAPLSWLLVDHVTKGRRRLNFSDWPQDDPRRAAQKWNRIQDEVSSGDMPLAGYTWLHPSARLSAEQRALLTKWAGREAGRLRLRGSAEGKE